ncbi:GNAT family N-acetyltransferase [Utexia brackfieldae]|uniref:GNAT family N-acetyltransferase n=1 Tax=Utexia brackfieldae TaxID=3074108 RepID=UPI00370D7DFC
MRIVKLTQYPAYFKTAANWFSSHWHIPAESYQDSMQISLTQPKAVPQWYMVLNQDHQIIAGAGVIDNDFHERTDLSPNLCALYVETAYRQQHIAKQLLDFIRADMAKMGFKQLYLITDHQTFYEKCGWQWLTMVQDNEGEQVRLYVTKTQ